jgi:hypothetical protein
VLFHLVEHHGQSRKKSILETKYPLKMFIFYTGIILVRRIKDSDTANNSYSDYRVLYRFRRRSRDETPKNIPTKKKGVTIYLS